MVKVKFGKTLKVLKYYENDFRYTGLFILTFVLFISVAISFSKCFVVWWLSSDANMFLLFVTCHEFQVSVIPCILNSLSKYRIVHHLGKVFFYLIFVDFSHSCVHIYEILLQPCSGAVV